MNSHVLFKSVGCLRYQFRYVIHFIVVKSIFLVFFRIQLLQIIPTSASLGNNVILENSTAVDNWSMSLQILVLKWSEKFSAILKQLIYVGSLKPVTQCLRVCVKSKLSARREIVGPDRTLLFDLFWSHFALQD